MAYKSQAKLSLCRFKINNNNLEIFITNQEITSNPSEDDVINEVSVLLKNNNDIIWVCYYWTASDKDSDEGSSEVIYAKKYKLLEP